MTWMIWGTPPHFLKPPHMTDVNAGVTFVMCNMLSLIMFFSECPFFVIERP